MSLPKIGGIDSSVVVRGGGPNCALVHQVRKLVQNVVLLDHIWRLEHRPSEHQFPGDGRSFALEGLRVESLRIVDDTDATLWGEQFHKRRVMLFGRVETRNIVDWRYAEVLNLLRHRLRVIDN